MCGRFTLEPTPKFYQRFKIDNYLSTLKPRYNIAPGQSVPVIIKQSPNSIKEMRWGLIPHWADDPKIGYKMINARAETLEEKSSYRSLLKSKRCLVPASGFYEWQATKAGKQPYYIKLKNQPLFAMAGLYDLWKDKDGREVYSFTIVTTDSNSLVKKIHQRMPVILDESEEELWLDKEVGDPIHLRKVLNPYNAQKMESYPVSRKVNKTSFDSKDLIEKVKPEIQPTKQRLIW